MKKTVCRPRPRCRCLPPCGPPPDRHAVRTGHDLLHLPDHRQEGDFQGRRRQQIDVTFETREAVVTFDDAKTSVQKLTKATGDAGYPSSVKQ